MKTRKTRTTLVVRDELTPEEQAQHTQDLVLKRAAEILAARKEKQRLDICVRKKLLKKIKRQRLLKRCRECGAMRYYLKNGGKR